MAIIDYSAYDEQSILNDMLQNVPSDIDTRQGSVIYNALAPVATFVSALYNQLEYLQQELDPTTASMNGLELLGSQIGIYPEYATTSRLLIKAVFAENVEHTTLIGNSFVCAENEVTYEVISAVNTAEDVYEVVSSEVGTYTNITSGTFFPMVTVEGLNHIEVVEILEYAKDDEDVDSFRQRYLNALVNKPFGGNIDYYKQSLTTIDGVGGVQVHPVWDGGGTVYLSVVGDNLSPIASDKITELQNIVDPTVNSSDYVTGVGLAPIDHKVTVGTPTQFTINVKLTIEGNYSTLDVNKAVNDYFTELRRNWDKPDNFGKYNCKVYPSQIVARVLQLGADNCTCLLNNSANTITLNEKNPKTSAIQLPVLGEVTING